MHNLYCSYCDCNLFVYEFNMYICAKCFYNSLIMNEIYYCERCEIFIFAYDTDNSRHYDCAVIQDYYTCRKIAISKYLFLIELEIEYMAKRMNI